MPVLTFEDYKKKILEAYDKIKNDPNHELSRFLHQLTPGKIKSASKIVLETGHSFQDLNTLSSYFKVSVEKDFLKFLETVDADKLIPVRQFLNKRTKDPREEVVEFAAWLLNFEQRPYSEFRKGKEGLGTSRIATNGHVKSTKNQNDTVGTSKVPWKKIIVTISISFGVLFVVLGIYWKPKKCMIWKGNSYEKVACGETNELQIALNPALLDNFQLVKLDTVEVYFKNGKPLYWYDKDKGEVEFFTLPGNHPTNGKKLKPITERIIRTYVDQEE